MKKIATLFIVAAVIFCISSTSDAYESTRPDFVWECMIRFDQHSDSHFAWSRMFGWGEGVYEQKIFYWFLSCNSDGQLHLWLSVSLSTADLKELERLKEGNDNWEGKIIDRKTSIDIAHSWFIRNCKSYEPGQCNNEKTTDEVVDLMTEFSFFRKLRVVEYF